jgi:hypothetical protein
MSRVELFKDNEWILISWHKNVDNAIINAEVIHRSSKCDIRVISEGKIVWMKLGNSDTQIVE